MKQNSLLLYFLLMIIAGLLLAIGFVAGFSLAKDRFQVEVGYVPQPTIRRDGDECIFFPGGWNDMEFVPLVDGQLRPDQIQEVERGDFFNLRSEGQLLVFRESGAVDEYWVNADCTMIPS